MKIDDVKALAEILAQSDVSLIEYKEGDLSIRIERAAAPPPLPQLPRNDAAVPAAAPVDDVEQQNDFNNMHELTAPMVGVFYGRAPRRMPTPFVKVGDHVEKGQVVCILEAMKLMNDITGARFRSHRGYLRAKRRCDGVWTNYYEDNIGKLRPNPVQAGESDFRHPCTFFSHRLPRLQS